MEEFAQKYLNILQGPLKGLNLTRIVEFNDFLLKQVVDSILPLDHCLEFGESLEKNKLLVDVGFGGGFPLLPLAYKFPQYNFIGLEARRKKADAVNLIAEDMGLNNIKAYHQRLEEVWFDLPCTITFKAVGNMADLLPKISGDKNQKVFFYKGPLLNDKENLQDIGSEWELISDVNYPLPGTEGRRFLGFKGVSVPRGTKYNKQLVKVSKLV